MNELWLAPAIDPARLALDRFSETGDGRRWHSLVMGVGDSLTRIALEAQDLLVKTRDPALAEVALVVAHR